MDSLTTTKWTMLHSAAPGPGAIRQLPHDFVMQYQVLSVLFRTPLTRAPLSPSPLLTPPRAPAPTRPCAVSPSPPAVALASLVLDASCALLSPSRYADLKRKIMASNSAHQPAI